MPTCLTHNIKYATYGDCSECLKVKRPSNVTMTITIDPQNIPHLNKLALMAGKTRQEYVQGLVNQLASKLEDKPNAELSNRA